MSKKRRRKSSRRSEIKSVMRAPTEAEPEQSSSPLSEAHRQSLGSSTDVEQPDTEQSDTQQPDTKPPSPSSEQELAKPDIEAPRGPRAESVVDTETTDSKAIATNVTTEDSSEKNADEQAPSSETNGPRSDTAAEISANKVTSSENSNIEDLDHENNETSDESPVDEEAPKSSEQHRVPLVSDVAPRLDRSELDPQHEDLDEFELEDTETFLKGLIESLLFSSPQPLAVKDIARLAGVDRPRAKELIAILEQEYATRGLTIEEVASGFVMRSAPRYGRHVQKLLGARPVRLSRAQLETLAIVAYRQPVTKPEVDDIRGVDSGQVVKGLLERSLLKILGKKDEPGRPMLYGTTTDFLELLNLQSLKDLPTLREYSELSEESRKKFLDETGETPPAESEDTDTDNESTLSEKSLADTPQGAATIDDIATDSDNDDSDDDTGHSEPDGSDNEDSDDDADTEHAESDGSNRDDSNENGVTEDTKSDHSDKTLN